MLEFRLNEISTSDTVYKLVEYEELVSYCVNVYNNVLSVEGLVSRSAERLPCSSYRCIM